jgi:hypothetical protein
MCPTNVVCATFFPSFRIIREQTTKDLSACAVNLKVTLVAHFILFLSILLSIRLVDASEIFCLDGVNNNANEMKKRECI